MGKKIILTGATGYVGEGVLLECLANSAIDEVLSVGRKASGKSHSKLKELLVKDFFSLDTAKEQLRGYDACFFCAGISSVGMNEADYTRITYDATIAFSKAVLAASPGIQFNYVSGAATDGSEQGRIMWARVKGRTENEIGRLGFKQSYNFRPGIMKPSPGQRNPKTWQRILVPIFSVLLPRSTCRMQDMGLAMINSVLKGYPMRTLEVKDIKVLAKA
ncbi:MAG: NAD-dependent epimerase/dehydratase family protein [Flavobacteriales bacterium]|jgi:nucleoside-diphosphate-sugar epimerase|nr:NAD-dependent epimerase/dehydratase family protein [Flavobacteriales bacterium]MBP6573518.1 NAD-dependent epimerase/dehydratase family protein [Flavobacteriales bacterium]